MYYDNNKALTNITTNEIYYKYQLTYSINDIMTIQLSVFGACCEINVIKASNKDYSFRSNLLSITLMTKFRKLNLV